MTSVLNPKLAAALSAVQGDLPAIGKGRTAAVETKAGAVYTYDYADLTDITAALMPLLSKHGLAFTARPTMTDGQFVLAYSLLYTSGEREDGVYPLAGGTPQAIGSAISYGRRYCLCAVTGVAPGGSDDDGAAATAHQVAEKIASPPIDPDVARLRADVSTAWRNRHRGQADPLTGLAADYEQFAAAPIVEAGVTELRAYLEHLVTPPATTEPDTLPLPADKKAADDE